MGSRSRGVGARILFLLSAVLIHACGDNSAAPGVERGPCYGNNTCNSGLICLSHLCVRPPDGGADDGGGSDSGLTASPLVVSTATRTPRTTTWSVNYWQWLSALDGVTGTDTLIAALKPATMRIGGYNNDANVPEAFGHAQLDTAVAYARAIGAEPIVQVPHLADDLGQPATAAAAAAMVAYLNVTMAYGIKYFSVGNEPDLYATQGLPTDQSQPAIPGYTPSAYCTSVTAYVKAMKAVDPGIKIVGPDLSYKYQGGGGDNDWLTPILADCGDLFDIIAIHRYPFSAAEASLAAATMDPTAFRSVMSAVRDILQATGHGAKPLALTEMNVAYDRTFCVLDASPGTVGSALWLADSLGTAIELGLWTSSVWNIGDTDEWSFGLLGMPPAHTPRPQYYAYSFYAEHSGPTLLNVTSAPTGVSAHASRNQADSATEIILINWNPSPAALAFSVTGLAIAPAVSTFVLPPVSIAAVEIPDRGAAMAWTYGEAERKVATVPQILAAGTVAPPASDGGASDARGAGSAVGANCSTDGAVLCPQILPPSPVITTMGTVVDASADTAFTFGSGAYKWNSYTYAAPGQSPPTAALTPDGNGIQIVATFVGPLGANYEGVGLFFDAPSCINASVYTGVKFDFAGDLGSCTLAFGASFSGDLSRATDSKGSCPGTETTCYGPLSPVVPTATTLMVPFSTLRAGAPFDGLDPSTLVDVEWQLRAPLGGLDGGGCSANFTVKHVSFY